MNKIIIRKNSKGEFYAVLKSRNGRQVWNTQPAGVKSRRTIKGAIALFSKPFHIIDETA